MSNHYIAVHAGAGNHSQSNEDLLKKALRRACVAALKNATTPCDPETASHHLDMVQTSIENLEDDPYLNAGTGSNLTLHGTVECDAAIMDGSSDDFGSVGAVSGVKNPIRLARDILNYSKQPDPLGRIPPLTLVSEGARIFARTSYGEESDQLVSPDSLKTPRTTNEWEKWIKRLDKASKEGYSNTRLKDDEALSDVQDTVGAVASTGWQHTAAGVSSGGLLLKHLGRVGEAALFGAGCWAQKITKAKMGVACSVSGAGEYITRSRLARAVADAILMRVDGNEEVDPHEILNEVIEREFLDETRGYPAQNLDAGILLLISEEIEQKPSSRLWCAFTTPSMAIAYASAENPKPKARILRQPPRPEHDRSKRRIFITAITL